MEIISSFKALILFLAGFFAAQICANAIKKIMSRYATSQQLMLLHKIVYFAILILFIVAALQQLGFRLTVLLGSAGIATAAIAIASQTTISNIISGLFLIMEKSFQIGDKIKIGETSGVIISIDLLSVKLLTAQNTLVRIPNETIIKSEITNTTRFDTRCLDIPLKISTEKKAKQTKDIVLTVVNDHHLVLKMPPPTVSVQNIGNDGITFRISVWIAQKNYEIASDLLNEEILEALQQKIPQRA